METTLKELEEFSDIEHPITIIGFSCGTSSKKENKTNIVPKQKPRMSVGCDDRTKYYPRPGMPKTRSKEEQLELFGYYIDENGIKRKPSLEQKHNYQDNNVQKTQKTENHEQKDSQQQRYSSFINHGSSETLKKEKKSTYVQHSHIIDNESFFDNIPSKDEKSSRSQYLKQKTFVEYFRD